MLIEPPRKPQKITSTHRVCAHHRKHPEDRAYPGCTCGGEWILSDYTITGDTHPPRFPGDNDGE